MLTIGSLFSGIGGLELGLERAGLGPVVWQCETDPFCWDLLRRKWPNAGRFTDVRDIIYLSPQHRTDIICGGFPCQDISDAGKRAGIEGERSSLWREFARIIDLARPRYVVVENVAALLGRGMGVILGDLAALGYDAEWDCIPAQAVGAPHRRDRVFIVAHTSIDHRGAGERRTEAGSRQNTKRRRGPTIGGADVADASSEVGRSSTGYTFTGAGGPAPQLRAKEPRRHGGRVVDASSSRPQRQGQTAPRRRPESSRAGFAWPPSPDDMHAWRKVQENSQPSICRVAHGIPDRVDRLRALGNAVVPQVAEVIGRRILELEGKT